MEGLDEQMRRLGEIANLGANVSTLMAALQKAKDPRLQELEAIFNNARDSHPDYNPPSRTGNSAAIQAGFLAVFEHVELSYRDNLYRIIQGENPEGIL